jgi:hypothetical protein
MATVKGGKTAKAGTELGTFVTFSPFRLSVYIYSSDAARFSHKLEANVGLSLLRPFSDLSVQVYIHRGWLWLTAGEVCDVTELCVYDFRPVVWFPMTSFC